MGEKCKKNDVCMWIHFTFLYVQLYTDEKTLKLAIT